ncbi:MAG TPA: hypothetical protein VNH19_11820, partial [Candidatus Limnocylindrales bacterium]|nr:hypothetical protein [Candidatus Limnocylindrales bacterium]
SQERLLELNEGKFIDFEVKNSDGGRTSTKLIHGRVIRSGYFDPRLNGYNGYDGLSLQHIVEVDGKLRFDLPGQPIFPALGDGAILKPALDWVIESAKAAKFDAEISYVTGEMSWESDYNLVLPEGGSSLDLTGWITMDNRSGREFKNARIKLMAGDVNKIQNRIAGRMAFGGIGGGGTGLTPPVAEKSFDEYHLYTLERPATLLDREKKQVEFIRAGGVKSDLLYIYDGASSDIDQQWVSVAVIGQPEYGTVSNPKIWAFREFANSAANHLGIPLPKGRIRIYRRNTDGQMEFTGENTIKHTPRDEVVRLFTGNVFDVIGERKRTNFRVNINRGSPENDPTTGLPIPGASGKTDEPPLIDESFEITLRNHKTENIEVRVVEHLYRWVNWEIRTKSDEFKKLDAQKIEFRVPLKPDEERKLLYTVRYTWEQ